MSNDTNNTATTVNADNTVKRAAMTVNESTCILAGQNNGTGYADTLSISFLGITGDDMTGALLLRPCIMVAGHNLVKRESLLAPGEALARTERAQCQWFASVSLTFGGKEAVKAADTMAEAIKVSGDWCYEGMDMSDKDTGAITVSAYYRAALVSYGSTSARRNVGDSLRAIFVKASLDTKAVDALTGAIKGEAVKRSGTVSASSVKAQVEAAEANARNKALSEAQEASINMVVTMFGLPRDVATLVATKQMAVSDAYKACGKPVPGAAPASTGGKPGGRK